MTTKDRLSNDIKDAMRAKDAPKLTTLRMFSAAIKQREVDERIELGEADVLNIVGKLIKQRRESIAAFEKGNRPELAAAEQAEITLLEVYLPAQLSEAAIDAIIDAAIAEAGIAPGQSGAAIGKLMALVKPKVAGQADMGVVSARIKAKLASLV